AKPVTDGQVRLAAVVGDILSQAVADDLGVDRRAVEEQLEAGSATRTIVSKRHVDPFIGGQRGSGADLERVARPEVVKPHGDATVFQLQFVAATSRVHGRLAVVKHALSGDV